MNDNVNLDKTQKELDRMGYAGIVGAVLGAAIGQYWFGIGGALLFLFVGALVLGKLASDEGLEAVKGCLGISIFFAVAVAIVSLISALWGVGRIAD